MTTKQTQSDDKLTLETVPEEDSKLTWDPRYAPSPCAKLTAPNKKTKAAKKPRINERDFMRPTIIAILLRVQYRTVIGWIKAGLLPASDLATPGSRQRRFFVRREDLDAFVASRVVATPKPKSRDRKPKRAAGSKQWV